MRVAERVWPEVQPTHVLVVPIGSTEQHGPHLPLSTDTAIAVVLTEGLARRRSDVLVAPPVPYGSSGEHAAFPGTLSIGQDVLESLLVELVRSADVFRGVVLVNAHGGNAEAVGRAVARLQGEERPVVAWAPAADGDAHAGRTETSLMLAIAPAWVRVDDAAAGDTRPIAETIETLRAEGVGAVSANGVLGDPAGANAPEGNALLARWIDELVAAVGGAFPGMSVAVVTGAARGIGAATAALLAADGWDLILVDACTDDPALSYPLATRADLDAVAAKTGGVPVVADVRDPAGLRAAVAIVVDRFGGVDAAVAAAGCIAGGERGWETSDPVWDAMFDVNVGGVRRLADAVVPALLARPAPRHGRFVAVSSAGGTLGLPRLAAYSAAKHAVVGYVRSLAAELGPEGVTVNAVAPGSTRTAMLDASAGIYGLADVDEFATHHLLGRLVDPGEVAALIAWLCGEASSGITGAVLPVDAGMTAS